MLWLNNIPDPLVIILGPTGVGKSDLAVQVALSLHAEIISADSRLFYKGMDIGTAKPSISDQKKVRHHLIDFLEPSETWTLVDFQSSVRKIISDLHRKNQLPILIGGTGQYIKAIIENWQAPPGTPDLKLRSIVEKIGKEMGPHELHRKLVRLDPEAAAHIEPNNLRRTVRAFEVIFTTGDLFSSQRKKGLASYSLCMVGLKRTRVDLYKRIDDRIDRMVHLGLLKETQSLLERGVPPDSPAMSAIGYREMVGVLENRLTIEEAITEMKRLTRQFARRQANWFKENDPRIHWMDADTTNGQDVVNLICSEISWIKKPSGVHTPDG